MISAKQPRGLLPAMLSLVFALIALMLPFGASSVRADSGARIPSGFADEVTFSGLDHPMAIAFASDGSNASNGTVFVAEKRGVIYRYDGLSDTTPTVFADLNSDVHNYWDRGLLGMTVDPDYPTRPYVYALYSYNHILGDGVAAPRWPTKSGSTYDDACPNPPGATSDGCVISGRLVRLTATNGVMTAQKTLIEDWCQQFPSHSVGDLRFGPEGALYVTAGDGANFNTPDYGQFGGSLPGTPTPSNPCGDPPGAPGTALTPPSAEGGAFRAQDLRTSGDPVGLDGTILRINPDTGAAWPTNSLIGASDTNARKIIGYGLRNPFRFTIRPGTSEVWLADVGLFTWEEVDRLTDPTAAPRNFGWPCWEGPARLTSYQDLGIAICSNLADNEVSPPYYTYRHSQNTVAGDGCAAGGASIAGITFLSATSPYPDRYDGGLFFADYGRRCIWFLPAGSGGLPQANSAELFANLDRLDSSVDGSAVYLTTAPSGDLVYVDYDRGEVRKVHYYGVATPPVASFSATPSSGAAPLSVTFDASASTTNVGTLTYAWDLDGDAQYDDATGVTTSRTYSTVGNVTVGLKVTNGAGSATTSRVVAVGNTRPSVTITAPTEALRWKVGDVIPFSGTATDAQDGNLPASAFQWTLTMRHCPSDCHNHIIESFSSVKSGEFDGPAHELPSYLRLSVTVTDSGGLTDSATVDIYARQGTVTTGTSPSGIQTTVGGTTGTSPSVTAMVNSPAIRVSAPASAVIGEGMWSFESWSDGGARSHDVPVVEGSTTLTATYANTGSTDAADRCSDASAPTKPSGKWQRGAFATTNDVDWYRFTLSKAKRVRLVLGDLGVAGRLALYKGCSTLLKVADRSGTGAEQIIKKLAAGNYAIRVSGSGTPSTGNYSVLMKKLPDAVRVLTSKALIEGSTLRLVGEVYDNTTRTVGPVRVTAKLYNAAGTLLTTRSTIVDLRFDKPRRRAPFSISGSLPAAYDHVKWTVDAPSTGKQIVAPARTVMSSGPDEGDRWVVSGTIRNTKSYTVRKLRFTVTLYDDRGDVLDVVRAQVGTRTLSPGASTTFVGRFTTTGLAPDRIYTRGMALR